VNGPAAYDSTADTLRHSRRVGELVVQVIQDLAVRAVTHDLSKTQPPELDTFNEMTPKLAGSTYGSYEYKQHLEAMGPALDHHYANNRHHPEFFGDRGVGGMTLVDLVEMLADWKAATERHGDGSLPRSLELNRERFGISEQLAQVLENTARWLGWFDGVARRGPRAFCDDQPVPHLPHEWVDVTSAYAMWCAGAPGVEQ
jgi:hypothetical protein